MSMATGVVMFVIGAILAFAVDVQLAAISLSTVGYILMGGGVVVFLIGLVLTLRGTRSVTTSRTAAPGGEQVVNSTTRRTDAQL